MLLKELLVGRTLPIAAANLAIRGLTADSRAVKPGYLFAALPGTKADGTRFIGEALENGAVAVLGPEQLPALNEVPIVRDENPRRALALAAARFYGRQPEAIAAVTGTSGKTSVTVFARQIWSALGKKAASIGTIGVVGEGGQRLDEGAALTTPDPVQLHALLDRLAGDGYACAALEASSHGLDQYRLDGVRIRAAAFTNLTHEHLDYHKDLAAYRRAKLRLFSELLGEGGTAVINVDTDEGETFATAAAGAGHPVWRVGVRGPDIKIVDVEVTGARQLVALEAFGRPSRIEVPLAGAFQVSNALLAAGLVIACGASSESAFEAIRHLEGAPGRLQLVGDVRSPGGTAAVYVDYAHKPDALRTVLGAVRPQAHGKLWLVFGCGGDRDTAKRPIMGEIASRFADRVVVTDDNPRTEDPSAIRQAILKGATGPARVEEIGDREQAIARAIAGLEAGDVLIIAGKGHETGQIAGDRVLPFDDVKIARSFIDRRNEARHG